MNLLDSDEMNLHAPVGRAALIRVVRSHVATPALGLNFHRILDAALL
jgi:hypothetical protein